MECAVSLREGHFIQRLLPGNNHAVKTRFEIMEDEMVKFVEHSVPVQIVDHFQGDIFINPTMCIYT